MDMDVLSEIRRELTLQADEEMKQRYQTFSKEPILTYGVKTALVNKLAKSYFREVRPLGKKAVFALCEELLKSDYNEEALVACNWAYWLHEEYETGDFEIFERWLEKYIDNWAKCDTLCNHAVGAFIERYPQYIENLKGWAKSENRWLRRASATTLIIPAKQGKFLGDIFQIADRLLEDKDDLVQKGYGWMLKEASINHRDEVFDYVTRNKKLMPRTALRYAIERMPKDMRQKAMAKPLS